MRKLKLTLRNLDMPLLVVTIILLVIGLIMIFSSSSITAVLRYGLDDYYYFGKQLVAALVGLVAAFCLFFVPTKTYNALSILGMVVIFAALAGLRLYGVTTNSATSWFSIGPFSIQPSEFSKTIIILYLATVYGNRKKFKGPLEMFMWMLPCVGVCLLIYGEPDLGTAAIIAITCMVIFFSLPLQKSKIIKTLMWIIILAVVVVIGGLSTNQQYLTNTQIKRFTFIKPCDRYLEETGYQVCNGYIAIHNGGLFGLGLGNSTQKFLYLPESHTDFIFPIIVEELGLVGGGIVLILYIILLFRVLVIARNASSLRGSIIAFGTFTLILTHITVNLGGALALMPLTGVPLPLISYGGSNLLNVLVLLAITERVAIETKEVRYKKEVKKVVG